MKLRSTDALIAIDVQNDFCAGGPLAVPEAEAVVPVVNALSARFPHFVLMQDWHPPHHSSFASCHPECGDYRVVEAGFGSQVTWPDHCVQGTPGAGFHPELETHRAELILRTGTNPAVDSYSAFQENDRVTGTGLTGWLRERRVRRVFLAGLPTDFGVQWSAVDAVRAGFEAVVVLDAVRGNDVDGSLESAFDAMKSAGVQFAVSTEIEP